MSSSVFCDSGSNWRKVPVRDIELYVDRDVVIEYQFFDRATREPIDWTDWSFAAVAKDATLVDTWATAVVTHGGTDGIITVVWPRSDTAGLVSEVGQTGKYDIEGTDPGGLHPPILTGSVLVVETVT